MGSSTAVASRPFASSGVAGQTTFSPAMCAKLDSGFCEWNGHPRSRLEETQHDRDRRARAVVLLRRNRDEVVPRARDEVRELHLGDRPHAHQRRAGRARNDRGLGERHVEHAARAELLLEALGDLERAAETPTSSPRTNTRSSRRISSRRESLIAWRYVFSAIALAHRWWGSRARRAWRRRRRSPSTGRAAGTLGPLDGVVEETLHAAQ